MQFSLVVLVVVGIWYAEGFAFKRSKDDGKDAGKECFAHIAAEVIEFYFKNEEAGDMVHDMMKECLKDKATEDECLNKKKAKFAEKFGEDGAKVAQDIMHGLAEIGKFVDSQCKVPKEEMAKCAGDAIQMIKDSGECDADCATFVDLFGQKGAECEEKEMEEEEEDKKSSIKRLLGELRKLNAIRK